MSHKRPENKRPIDENDEINGYTVNRGNLGRFFDVIELGNHFIPISAERHPQI